MDKKVALRIMQAVVDRTIYDHQGLHSVRIVGNDHFAQTIAADLTISVSYNLPLYQAIITGLVHRASEMDSSHASVQVGLRFGKDGKTIPGWLHLRVYDDERHLQCNVYIAHYPSRRYERDQK